MCTSLATARMYACWWKTTASESPAAPRIRNAEPSDLPECASASPLLEGQSASIPARAREQELRSMYQFHKHLKQQNERKSSSQVAGSTRLPEQDRTSSAGRRSAKV